ncbi:MAG TPA: efflux RND transporter periplasmic adaptor subunit [Nitrospiria bacterium]|nr:efflux RND transporter periplasmic adaptor subunit [Nitrospiria bacterium]
MKDTEIETDPTDLSRLRINWKDGGPTPGQGRKPRRRIWIIAGTLTILIAAGGYILLVPSPQRVETATVALVDPSQPTVVLNASGYVVAQRQAAVASKGTGRLMELNVREGDRVKKGEIIARLESADMAAALSRARANLNVARSVLDQARAEFQEATLNYDRKKSLYESALAPKADFDAAEAGYRRAQAGIASAEAGIHAAEAAVKAAEVEVENTIIRAPFNGTVLTKNAEVGEVVAPFGSSTLAKAAVVTMADMDSLEVEADVSESSLEKVRVGQRCEITLDAYPETRYDGIVQTIVPTADRAKATILTKVRFLKRDDRVLPEMSAKVSFLSEPPRGQAMPSKIGVQPGAIILRGEKKVAYLIHGNRVEEVSVETGDPVGSLVEVKRGLKPGDRVVINPPEGLKEGSRVENESR